jgi:hypothetical protein
LKGILRGTRFEVADPDPGYFIRKDGAGKVLVHILVYVDDLLIRGVDSDVKAVQTCWMEAYKVRDLGEAHCFLSIEMERDWVKGTVHLRQSKLIKDTHARFNMETSKSQMAPMAQGQKVKHKGDVLHC